jgi:hypothetical protein
MNLPSGFHATDVTKMSSCNANSYFAILPLLAPPRIKVTKTPNIPEGRLRLQLAPV